MAKAATVTCDAWYQEQNKEKEVLPMLVRRSTVTNLVFATEHNGYSYTVDWNYAQGVAYVDIEYGMPQANVLFVTGRPPSADLPRSLTDLHLPSGLRLSVDCWYHP